MKEPRIYVDFNEMVEEDLVLLSKNDTELDSAGNLVHLSENMFIKIYMDDVDEANKIDNLLAEGIVERNTINEGWGTIAKWNCRINHKGIYHESDHNNDANK
ncbi:hypothetical protein [Chryseobacterium sp.]|uniref:hypothetical protein n=1 Tax=Chryseobacterium sp. TaxID=1871047 RepID=UPI003890542E